MNGFLKQHTVMAHIFNFFVYVYYRYGFYYLRVNLAVQVMLRGLVLLLLAVSLQYSILWNKAPGDQP